MNRRQTTPRRVVIFASWAPGQGLWEGPDAGPGGTAVASAYEAAAELLAAPAAALVVDLRLLRPAHVRLVEIARKAGAQLWGVGPLPPWASSDQLDGMRLLSRAQLAGALRELAAGAQAPPAGGPPAGPSGTYEANSAARQAAPADEPLLTTEELNALLGDVK